MFHHEVTGMCDSLRPTPSTQRPAAQYFLPLVAKQRGACCQNVIKINKTGTPHLGEGPGVKFYTCCKSTDRFPGRGGPSYAGRGARPRRPPGRALEQHGSSHRVCPSASSSASVSGRSAHSAPQLDTSLAVEKKKKRKKHMHTQMQKRK